MKINPKDFLLNTDYEMDKIVYYTTGEMTPGSKSITHNLGFTPLLFGVGAFNSDFSDSRMSPYISWSPTVSFQFSSNNTYINFNYSNSGSSTKKLYYRIYAFEPADSYHKVPATTKYAKEFIINTDYNYCKLYKKGVATGDLTIKHNFGYIPLVLAWDYGNNTTYHWFNDVSDYITVTETEVRIKNSNSNGKVQYRIYYDEV